MTEHPQILLVFRRMINRSSIETPGLVPQGETATYVTYGLYGVRYLPLFRNFRVPFMENPSFK